MDYQSDKEVNLRHDNKSILPGYLYNATKKEFSPSKDAENVSNEDLPISFSFDFWDKKHMSDLQKDPIFKDNTWVKDYDKEHFVDAVMVKGVKVLEKRGIEVPSHHVSHRVTSLYFKYHINMLMMFSQAIPKESLEKLRKHILRVCNANESIIPNEISKFCKCTYIYPRLIEPGNRVNSLERGLKEFCRIIRESQVSSRPVTAFIKAPCQSVVKSDKAIFENSRDTERAVKGQLDGAHFNNTSENNNVAYSNNITKNSAEGEPVIHSKTNTCHSPHQKEESASCQSGRGHGTRQRVSGTHTRRVLGTMQGRGVARIILSETEPSGESRRYVEISHQESGNRASEESLQKYGTLTSNHPSNMETPFTSKNKSADIVSTGEKESINYRGNDNCPDQQWKEGKTVEVSELTKDQESKVTEHNIKKESNKTFQNGDQSIAKKKTEKEEKQMINSEMDEEMSQHRLHEKEERCSSSSRNDGNVSRYKSGEKKEKYMSTTDKNGKFPEEKVHSKSDTTTCDQGCSTKKAEEGLKKEMQVDLGKESETLPKDERLSAKNNDTDVNQKHPDSASISQNQKRLGQGLGVDNSDTNSLLKNNTQTSANITKKPKRGKEKQKMLKSRFLNPEKTMKDACGLERKYYGIMNNEYPEKVILLLGASGSGKTMLLNFIANYFQGKKTADDELIHVENTTPTSAITAYTFCSSLDEIPITIIDTPGLNDSSGAEIRDHVQSLKTFLANASSKGLEIHAIGFVAQAYLVRLTSSERLVMDYVSTMFGQSVSEHLITFVTFADNQDTPPVVEAMKNYGVNSKLFLKFNNSALNNTKSDEIDDLDRAYWRVCWRNWRKCLKTVRDLPSLGVNTMKALQSVVYAATVIDSAEKDLLAELKTFFTYCKKGNCISKDALQVCEKIWELGAIVHRLRHEQNVTSYTLDNIITERSLEACKILYISPEKYVGNLSLSPSGPLVVSGSAIVRTMAPFYKFAKRTNPEKMSKSITEWAHCLVCNDEHKMNRYEITGWIKLFLDIVLRADVLALKCEQCNCPGETHGVSSVESPLRLVNILRYTQDCLKELVNQNCLPGFPVEAKIFLEFLYQHCHLEYQEFILDLVRMTK